MNCSNQKYAKGFSLIELVMVLGVSTLLAGAIFGVMVSTFQLSAELKQSQDRKILRHRFVEIFQDNFIEVASYTKFSMKTTQDGSTYVGTLMLEDAPSLFKRTVENHSGKAEHSVVIRTGKGRGGFIGVSLHYLTQDQSKKFAGGDSSVLETAPSILLTDRMKRFEFELYDPLEKKWTTEWTNNSQRPTMVALTLFHEGEQTAKRHVFWVPSRQPANSTRS